MDGLTQQQQEFLMSEVGFRRQLESIADVYSRMSDACHNKCISSYKQGDLTLAESICVDRCVVKYMEVQGKIQERLMSGQ